MEGSQKKVFPSVLYRILEERCGLVLKKLSKKNLEFIASTECSPKHRFLANDEVVGAGKYRIMRGISCI